mmetsp:Transcript_5064/g.11197  ORF Transcript_5064/g.11197 Transcript_5064/m.11197 type:complete len:143 (+) Transcript_5064:87-515(+)
MMYNASDNSRAFVIYNSVFTETDAGLAMTVFVDSVAVLRALETLPFSSTGAFKNGPGRVDATRGELSGPPRWNEVLPPEEVALPRLCICFERTASSASFTDILDPALTAESFDKTEDTLDACLLSLNVTEDGDNGFALESPT